MAKHDVCAGMLKSFQQKNKKQTQTHKKKSNKTKPRISGDVCSTRRAASQQPSRIPIHLSLQPLSMLPAANLNRFDLILPQTVKRRDKFVVLQTQLSSRYAPKKKNKQRSRLSRLWLTNVSGVKDSFPPFFFFSPLSDVAKLNWATCSPGQVVSNCKYCSFAREITRD